MQTGNLRRPAKCDYGSGADRQYQANTMEDRLLAALVLLMGMFSTASCHRFHPPSQAQLTLLRSQQTADSQRPLFERREILVRATGSSFAGQFEGVWVARRTPRPQLRLQLFPDVGSKVLDLVVGPNRVTVGTSPQSQPYQRRFGPDGDSISRGVTVFAISLQQHWTGLVPSDVTGIRAAPNGYLLQLRDHASGVSVHARVDSQMRLQQWLFGYRGVNWRLEVGSPLRFVAADARIEITTTAHERLRHLPAQLFSIAPATNGS